MNPITRLVIHLRPGCIGWCRAAYDADRAGYPNEDGNPVLKPAGILSAWWGAFVFPVHTVFYRNHSAQESIRKLGMIMCMSVNPRHPAHEEKWSYGFVLPKEDGVEGPFLSKDYVGWPYHRPRWWWGWPDREQRVTRTDTK